MIERNGSVAINPAIPAGAGLGGATEKGAAPFALLLLGVLTICLGLSVVGFVSPQVSDAPVQMVAQ